VKQSAKILIADDDPDFRELLKQYLATEGYVIIEAGDGKEVFNLAVTERPDVVLLDVMMPSRDGFDICREIKSDKRTRGSAVVMLTVKNSLSDKLSGYVAGAQRYISKPCNLNEITDCVKAVLRQKDITKMQFDQDLHGT
jgi:two-component system, OmpR family, alkaline phosphatase synthesis response regulator PhoP